MKAITSRDNPLYKRLLALAGSTRRQRNEGSTVLEGAHLAQGYLERRGQPEACIVAERALHQPEVAALLERVDATRIMVFADALYDRISPVVNGIGLMLLVAVPSPSSERLPTRIASDCVVLDGVQDAGNVGSILRSAAAAGVGCVLCMPGTAHAWSPKVLRAAMGAHFVLEIFEDEAANTLAQRLDSAVAITDSHAATSLYECDLRAPIAWVFGNEGAGVSAVWRERAVHRLIIPQRGEVESLNVAAAAAVCLFEQARQRGAAAGRPPR